MMTNNTSSVLMPAVQSRRATSRRPPEARSTSTTETLAGEIEGATTGGNGHGDSEGDRTLLLRLQNKGPGLVPCVLTGHRPSPPREKSRSRWWCWRPLFRAGDTEVAGDAPAVAFFHQLVVCRCMSPSAGRGGRVRTQRIGGSDGFGIGIVSGETLLCATPTHGHVSSLLLRTAGLAGPACG